MTITLCIIGWLLSGFLAAWIAHKLDEMEIGRSTVSVRVAFWLSIFGGLSLLVVISYVLFKSELMSKPFFKAKEPK